jgi:hypothetical protein
MLSLLVPPNKVSSKLGVLKPRCPRRSHRVYHASGNATLCTWTLHYTGILAKARVIAMQKAWIIAGLSEDCKSKSHHKKIVINPEALPSLEVLESQKPPEDRPETDTEAAETRAKHRAVRRPKGSKFAASFAASSAGPLVLGEHVGEPSIVPSAASSAASSAGPLVLGEHVGGVRASGSLPSSSSSSSSEQGSSSGSSSDSASGS